MIKNWQSVLARTRAALMRRGRTEHDADDLVQEAWVRLECYRHEHPVHNPEAFLMQTALNLSIDSHRARLVRGEKVLLEDAVLFDPRPSAEAVLMAREQLEQLSVCLGRLSDKTRAIFLAQRLDGLSYQEIAKLHGLSVSSVEKHIAKATMQISSWMQGW